MPVCAIDKGPVPIDEPLFTVRVPLPIVVPPVNELPVPDRINVPAACLISVPLPLTFPENVSVPAPPLASSRVSAANETSPCHTIAAPLAISSEGLVVCVGLNVNVCVVPPNVPATFKVIRPPVFTAIAPAAGSEFTASMRSRPPAVPPFTVIPPSNVLGPLRRRLPLLFAFNVSFLPVPDIAADTIMFPVLSILTTLLVEFPSARTIGKEPLPPLNPAKVASNPAVLLDNMTLSIALMVAPFSVNVDANADASFLPNVKALDRDGNCMAPSVSEPLKLVLLPTPVFVVVLLKLRPIDVAASVPNEAMSVAKPSAVEVV